MSIKVLDLKDITTKLVEKKSLFFIPKDSSKCIRFVGDINSFIPIQLHKKYNIETKKYFMVLCYDDECPYCDDMEPKQDLFLPIYECDYQGSISVHKEKLWQLPYINIYLKFVELNKPIKDNIQKFVVKINRVGNNYDFDFKYIFPDFDNLDRGVIANKQDDWIDFLVSLYGDSNMKQTYKDRYRTARIVDEMNTLEIGSNSGDDNKVVGPQPTGTLTDSYNFKRTNKGKQKQ